MDIFERMTRKDYARLLCWEAANAYFSEVDEKMCMDHRNWIRDGIMWSTCDYFCRDNGNMFSLQNDLLGLNVNRFLLYNSLF